MDIRQVIFLVIRGLICFDIVNRSLPADDLGRQSTDHEVLKQYIQIDLSVSENLCEK